MITNDYYDKFCEELAKYPQEDRLTSIMYCGLGLTGEAGEVADKIKKIYRDGVLNEEAIALELGDVAYYLTRLANHFGYTLNDILTMNVKKLSDRRDRNVVHGNGDNR